MEATRKAPAASTLIEGSWAPATVDPERRTVEVIWSAGSDVERVDPWTGQRYLERLEISDQAVDLSRLRSGGPVLDSHSQDGIRSQLGTVESAWIVGGKGHARIRFSERHADVFEDVAAGIIRGVSVGYIINEIREIEGEDGTLRVREATRWTPFEISLVTVPADQHAQTRAHTSSTPANGGAVRHDGENMETKQANGAAPKPPTNVLQLERDRTSAILDCGEKLSQRSLAAELIGKGTPLSEARGLLIDAAANEPTNATEINHRISPDDDSRLGSFSEAAAEGLLLRERVLKKSDNADARELANSSLIDIAKRSAALHGVSLESRDPTTILKRAFITSTTLADTVATFSSRAMMEAYQAPPRTFEDAFRESSARNFKANERIRLSDAPALAAVAEGADFQEVTLSDRKETYAVSKFGHILKFTIEAMVNDDLQALVRQAELAGFSAATTESDTFWAVITDNNNLSDAAPIFGAGTGNLTTGVALSADALEDIREAFRTAQSETGVALNLMPKYLFVAADLERTAEKLVNPPINHSTATLTDVLSNAYASSLELRVEPRLPAGDYMVACDYRQCDQAEYAWLDGARGPQLTSEEDFNSAGIKYRVADIFGAGVIDRRGLFYNDAA